MEIAATLTEVTRLIGAGQLEEARTILAEAIKDHTFRHSKELARFATSDIAKFDGPFMTHCLSRQEKKPRWAANEADKLATALTGDRVGAVVVFKPGVSEQEAMLSLSQLTEIDHEQGSNPQTFDPESGWPVWYIP